MPQSERDNFGSWCMFLLGSLMASSGSIKVYDYLTGGRIVHRPSRLLPLDLVGSDAALFYGLYFLVGVFLLAAGTRRLRAT